MSELIWFIVGGMVGGTLGVFGMALLQAGRRGDEAAEREGTEWTR